MKRRTIPKKENSISFSVFKYHRVFNTVKSKSIRAVENNIRHYHRSTWIQSRRSQSQYMYNRSWANTKKLFLFIQFRLCVYSTFTKTENDLFNWIETIAAVVCFLLYVKHSVGNSMESQVFLTFEENVAFWFPFKALIPTADNDDEI